MVNSEDLEVITEKIQQYCEEKKGERRNIKFDTVRLGTMYYDSNPLIPISGISNGTVIAIGNNQSKIYQSWR